MAAKTETAVQKARRLAGALASAEVWLPEQGEVAGTVEHVRTIGSRYGDAAQTLILTEKNDYVLVGWFGMVLASAFEREQVQTGDVIVIVPKGTVMNKKGDQEYEDFEVIVIDGPGKERGSLRRGPVEAVEEDDSF